jgi:hypothetical protein
VLEVLRLAGNRPGRRLAVLFATAAVAVTGLLAAGGTASAETSPAGCPYLSIPTLPTAAQQKIISNPTSSSTSTLPSGWEAAQGGSPYQLEVVAYVPTSKTVNQFYYYAQNQNNVWQIGVFPLVNCGTTKVGKTEVNVLAGFAAGYGAWWGQDPPNPNPDKVLQPTIFLSNSNSGNAGSYVGGAVQIMKNTDGYAYNDNDAHTFTSNENVNIQVYGPTYDCFLDLSKSTDQDSC